MNGTEGRRSAPASPGCFSVQQAEIEERRSASADAGCSRWPYRLVDRGFQAEDGVHSVLTLITRHSISRRKCQLQRGSDS